jgi:hypothetical protein
MMGMKHRGYHVCDIGILGAAKRGKNSKMSRRRAYTKRYKSPPENTAKIVLKTMK